MKYLTQSHKTPPRHVQHDGMLTPTAPLIKREDTAALAVLGIYPHVTASGDAPLGYTDWQFDGTQYTRKPAGTPEEREVARKENQRAAASLSRAQFKLALLAAGYLDDIEAAYPSWPRNIQIMWDDSSTFDRMHPDLIQLGEAMGYTDEQMDALFGIESPLDPEQS